MISEEHIRDALTHILAQTSNVSPDEISGQETLDMLGIDSAATLQLASKIEELFEVLIDPQDVAGDATVRELSQLIVRKKLIRMSQSASNNHLGKMS